jgi:hypothetical protein
MVVMGAALACRTLNLFVLKHDIAVPVPWPGKDLLVRLRLARTATRCIVRIAQSLTWLVQESAAKSVASSL